MSEKSTPFRQSWTLYAQALAAAWIAGPLLAYFGYYGIASAEPVIVVLSGLALFCGPVMIVAAPFMPRPRVGPCPLCGAKMVQMFGAGEGGYLVCARCAAYSRADGDSLTLAPVAALSDTPLFAAALPWDDVVGATAKTIAFSAEDVVMDKAGERLTRNDGERVIDKWPQGCCVCGAPASRHENAAVEVSIKGRALETKATIAAKGVPYCAAHKDGIAFARVEFAVGLFADAAAFALKFRSHAAREAFRKLNPHKFDSEAPGPLKVRTR